MTYVGSLIKDLSAVVGEGKMWKYLSDSSGNTLIKEDAKDDVHDTVIENLVQFSNILESLRECQMLYLNGSATSGKVHTILVVLNSMLMAISRSGWKLQKKNSENPSLVHCFPPRVRSHQGHSRSSTLVLRLWICQIRRTATMHCFL